MNQMRYVQKLVHGLDASRFIKVVIVKNSAPENFLHETKIRVPATGDSDWDDDSE